MTEKETHSDQAADLRRRAEEKVREDEIRNKESFSPDRTWLSRHELRVHQIELEMQNEELRRAQAELDAARARYFDLYDMAPVGYVTVSEKGLILEANLTAAGLLGVARGALVRQPLSRFIYREDEYVYYQHRKQLFETGKPQVWELRMLRADAPFWARMEATVAQDSSTSSGPDADSAPVCRVVLSDISDRKRAEEERAKLEHQFHQLEKTESLSRVAGAIAHQFNNEIQAVMGYLDLALSAPPHDAGCVALLTQAMQAAHKAAGASGLVLLYLGQTVGKHEALDLAEICGRGLPLLQAAMPAGAVVESDLPSPGPVISADANQIQQILTNLVTNAWEAGDEGRNPIRLTVKTVSPADIPAAHRFPQDWRPRGNAYACLEVADAGCGIAAADIERLFDPFFSSKFAGRGLGLSVVLGLVKAHGGVVTVESEPGRGSAFRVVLPVSAEEIPRQPERVADAPEIHGGGMVLLVEDEEMVRNVARTMLTRLDFRVIEAKDGVEAVEALRQHRDEIRCVLCDLTMPRMDGWQTLKELRKLAPGIPVILASGYGEAQVMAGGHPEQPDVFLKKPYRLKRLGDAIRNALDRGKPAH